MKTILTRVLAGLILAMLLPVAAQADLSITPVRIVFEERGRAATIELVNLTNGTNTYRLGWVLMKAKEKGGYDMLPPPKDDKDPYAVTNMVIFTPRQVTIEPHGHQLVRLSLRRPADLPPGEYRAHLTMTRLAHHGLDRPDDPNASKVSFALNVNLGFSVPVIVRSGDDKDLKVSLNSPKLIVGQDKKTPFLDIDLHRDAGKFSTYGTLKVTWLPDHGKEQAIGTLDNVALFPELQQREVNIRLNQNPTSGTLKVAYIGKLESEGRIWAETSFPISK